MMTNKEFVQKLKNIAARKTIYKNNYPYNLGYYDGTQQSFDCWNLIKALIWDNDIDQNYTVGTFARPNVSTGLGDWTVSGMIDACLKADPNSVSSDFSDLSKIPAGALLYYSDGSHAGTYIGDGKAIESTIAWDRCVQYTDVTPAPFQGQTAGKRSKNGITSGYWTKWAKMPWINYVDSVVSTPVVNVVDSSVPKWYKGDTVTLRAGAYIYGTTRKYQSWVYNTTLVVAENSLRDRAVVNNMQGACIGPVYSSDLTSTKTESTQQAVSVTSTTATTATTATTSSTATSSSKSTSSSVKHVSIPKNTSTLNKTVMNNIKVENKNTLFTSLLQAIGNLFKSRKD